MGFKNFIALVPKATSEQAGGLYVYNSRLNPSYPPGSIHQLMVNGISNYPVVYQGLAKDHAMNEEFTRVSNKEVNWLIVSNKNNWN